MEVTAKDPHNVAFASYSARSCSPRHSWVRLPVTTYLVIYGQNRFRPTAR
jgi:hypothetical protein